MQNTKLLLTSFTFVGLLALAGCSFPGVYKIDIQQGNVVTQDMIDQLRPGMTRPQVRFIMGNPLLADTFHADRWDYVFTIRRQGVEPQSRRLTVFFKGDVLDRFEGDEMPSEAEFVASLDSRRKNVKVPVLEATEEQLQKSARPAAQQAAETATTPTAAPASTSYPPLESSRR